MASQRALTLLHLCAWAQLGVLVRVTVGNLFGAACGSLDPWVPCITSSGHSRGGALFIDLPINVVGSFLMGLLSSTDQLASLHHHDIPFKAAVAAWPLGSLLQMHTPLHIGLRTGLCGSLTTFASWMVQMVSMMVGEPQQPHAGRHSTQWMAALCGLFLGTAAALAAVVLGQHMALWVHHHLCRQQYHTLELEGSSSADQRCAAADASESHTSGGAFQLAGVKEPSGSSATTNAILVSSSSHAFHQSGDGNHGLYAPQVCSSPACPTAADPGRQQQQQQQHLVQRQPLHTSSRRSSPAEAPASGLVQLEQEDELPSPPPLQCPAPPSRGVACTLADLMAASTAGVLTGVSLWKVITESPDGARSLFSTHPMYIAVLLGPVGCLLRFYLAPLNGSCRGQWSWFPAGTFAANIGACVLDYVMKVMLLFHGLDTVQGALLAAVITGVGGCLSTVSTWVVEIQKLLLNVRTHADGYLYMLGSLVMAIILGLVVYGIPVWVLF